MDYYQMDDEAIDDEVDMAWGENVLGLADKKNGQPSNLDYCHEFYNEKAKLLPVTFHICPTMMQWKVARPRLWILLFSRLKAAGIPDSMIVEIATE
eukprot:12426908-Karenia_brevis.AAC.1